MTMHIPTPAERAAEVAALRASARQHDRRCRVTRSELVAALQGMAKGGMMPRHVEYNAQRPQGWPTGCILVQRFSTSWAELAQEAGLRLQPKGGR